MAARLDGPCARVHSRGVGTAETVDRMAREADAATLARARAAFEARTGSFAPGEPWYEERIRAAFDDALATFEGGALARTFAARADVQDAERAVARALPRSERGVFVAERGGAEHVICASLLGARFEVLSAGVAERLRGGERFDGRIASIGGVLEILPGAVFHPAEAHEALAGLAVEIAERGLPAGLGTQADLADAILRMKMRFDRFTSIHARHVYRYDALARTEILAASWARPEHRSSR